MSSDQRDNVDLLALQLADNGLHTATAHTDTGADRVDVGLVADHRNLGAGAGSRATDLISIRPS